MPINGWHNFLWFWYGLDCGNCSILVTKLTYHWINGIQVSDLLHILWRGDKQLKLNLHIPKKMYILIGTKFNTEFLRALLVAHFFSLPSNFNSIITPVLFTNDTSLNSQWTRCKPSYRIIKIHLYSHKQWFIASTLWLWQNKLHKVCY